MAPPLVTSTTAPPSPTITRDPRFRAGRKLVGTADGVEMFALLLAEAREKYSADHVETIPGYYEYGNALLRYAQRGVDEEEETTQEVRRDAAAAAAERRVKEQQSEEDSKKPAATPTAAPATKAAGENCNDQTIAKESATADSRTEQDTEDVALALEMMETAWSILDENLSSNKNDTYTTWMLEQRPRILTGLGDSLIELQRPADATDAYLQALQHRQDAVPAVTMRNTGAEPAAPPHTTLQTLQARRRVVEANILVTEALLACRAQYTNAAVVTSETRTELVPAGQVVSYATGYYDKARDELEEVVVLLGQLAATKESGVDQEKEDVCFVATLVMGAGETLAQIDDEKDDGDTKGDVSGTEPAKKKPKR